MSETAGSPGGVKLAARQAFFLGRYVLARLLVERIELFFLGKWVFGALGLLLVVVGGHTFDIANRALGVVLLVGFAVLFALQLAVAAVIRRLAVPRRYRPAFAELDGIGGEGWLRRLRAEMSRVGLPTSAVRLPGLLLRLGLRRLRPAERDALGRLDLRRVLGESEFRRFRAQFAAADVDRAP